MIKKVFTITMFGDPFPWINEYIDHMQHLEQYGWYWKIFTPHDIKSKGNVEIVSMTTDDFNSLVANKLGVMPNLYISKKGVPSVHVTDFYTASGIIFEDYLKDANFWGVTNMDVVYGRLDHYLPDAVLEDCDVFTDDVNIINGVFCLFKNTEYINNLFKKVPQWKDVIGQGPCAKCCGEGDKHTLYGSDEYHMTEIMREEKTLKYLYPKYYPLHSYDRLEQHVPTPKLEIKEDGSLYELFRDTYTNQLAPYVHFSGGCRGHEIMYFHFSLTKKWPIL